MTYNTKHPELEDGEMFLSNMLKAEYYRVRWNTKRRGSVAYNENGNIIKGYVPVFVQKQEYDERMRRYKAQ